MSPSKHLLERNIKLIYVIASLMWMRFYIPVFALFYIASQVPFEQFTVIMGVFSLAILLLEIPSGVLADILGRRRTLLISRVLYVIELVIIAFCNGFWPFFIAKIISGIGVSMSSGTDSALLYDTLKKLKREKEHKKIAGKLHSITNVSKAFVFLIGAYLFTLHPKLPAYASFPLVAVGTILTWWLTEPYRNKKKLTAKNSWNHMLEGLKYVKSSTYVRFLVWYSLPIAATINIMLTISSAYLELVKLPISLIGALAFVASMLTAYMAKRAHSIEEKYGERRSLQLIQATVFLGVVGMSLVAPYIGIAIYLLIPIGAGFFRVVIDDYMNHHIPSSHRATMISVKNFFNQVGAFILYPVVGYLTRDWSMSFALSVYGGFLIVYFTSLTLYTKKLRITFSKSA